MGIFEGLIGGFGKAYGAHRADEARRLSEQSTLEQGIFQTLLKSDRPEVQMAAVQGMLGAAGGKGAKRKPGFLGGIEPSRELTSLLETVKKSSAAMPERSLVENTEEGGIPTQTVTYQPERTPPPLFRTGEERRVEAGRAERAGIMSELEGQPEDVRMAAAYGVRPTPPARPVSVPQYGSVVDPTTGQLMYQDPRARPEPPAYGSAGRAIYDRRTGKITGYGPESAGVPRDRPEYLDAQAAQEQIEAELVRRHGKLAVEGGPRYDTTGAIARDREDLARQYGWQSYGEIQRQGAFRRGTPGAIPPPPGIESIMGQGPEVDDQRAAEIQAAWDAGTPPSPQDQEFIRRYLELYNPP